MLANNSKTYHTNKFCIKSIQRPQDKIFKIIGALAVHALPVDHPSVRLFKTLKLPNMDSDLHWPRDAFSFLKRTNKIFK